MVKGKSMRPRAHFKTPDNKRLQVFPRANVAGQVLIHNEANLYVAPLANISAGGLFVEKLGSIDAGSLVRLVVKSPRIGQVIQASGTVVRVENGTRGGLAIEFTSISTESREAIQTCVYEAKMESVLKIA